jgi:hypothetical protein
VDRETATRWLLLDNFRNGWLPTVGLGVIAAGQALAWAKANKLVRGGKLTSEGETAFRLLGKE